MTASRISPLDADTSFIVPYSALSDYFDRMQTPQQGIEVVQEMWMRSKTLTSAQSQDQLESRYKDLRPRYTQTRTEGERADPAR